MNIEKLLTVTEVEISYKSKIKPSERPKISGSAGCSEIFRAIHEFNKNIEYKEMFYVMFLNRNNKVLSVQKIAEGTTSACLVDVKMIMQGAILQNASSLILCHNHPSGNLRASAEDINITRKIKDGAKLFDVAVLDHIILTDESYISLADEGQI